MAKRELSDHQRMIEAMRERGLRRDQTRPKCLRCERKSEWVSEHLTYCYTCLHLDWTLEHELPPTHFGKLDISCDPNEPIVAVSRLVNGDYLVAQGEHSVWSGCVMEPDEFESVTELTVNEQRDRRAIQEQARPKGATRANTRQAITEAQRAFFAREQAKQAQTSKASSAAGASQAQVCV